MNLPAKLPSQRFVGPLTLQGDAHGKLDRLAKPGHPVIQVGDLGIGFVHPIKLRHQVTSRQDFWFIRGNHDAPALCRSNPRYLGDWGGDGPMFWVSGAWSIDQQWRIEGRSWWRDEELNVAQGLAALDAYLVAKPRLMITHDGPESLFQPGGPMEISGYHSSSTARLLQAMLEAHAPEAWIFGHHHVSRDFTLGRTRFRCLAELETVEIEIGPHGEIHWPG